MWWLLVLGCRVVESPKGATPAPVRPIPVTLVAPESAEKAEPFEMSDGLGLPLAAQNDRVQWEVGRHALVRTFLPGSGPWRRSLLPVKDDGDSPFYARIVRFEAGPLDEDLDQLRYQRSLSTEGVQESLSVERLPVPPEKLALLRRQRGPLVPPPYAALLGPGSLPSRNGEQELLLREPTVVQVLLVGGPSPADEALVDLAGRRILLPRDRLFALPTHAMLAATPPNEGGDTTLPVVVTAVKGGEATVQTEQGSRQVRVSALSPVRVTGSELLGDLPGESWLWLSEDRPEGRRIYLEQPVLLRGLELPAGLVLELAADGTIAAVEVEEAVHIGERRLAPGTKLLVGEGCTFRESPLAQAQLCLDVVEGRLLPR